MAIKTSFSIVAIDKFTAIAKKVNNSISTMTNRLKKFTKENLNAKSAVKSFARTAIGKFGAIGAAFAGIFTIKSAADVGMDYEDRIASIARVSGRTIKEIKDLDDEFFELATKYKMLPVEVAGAADSILAVDSKIIENKKEFLKVMDAALLMTTVGGGNFTAKQSAELLMAQQSIFGGDPMENAKRFAAAANVGNAELDDLSGSYKNAADSAKEFGVTQAELLASFEVLASRGLKGPESGTALRGIFKKLSLIGVDPEQIGFINSLKTVESFINSAETKQEKMKRAQQVFTGEFINQGLALINNIDLIGNMVTDIESGKDVQKGLNTELSRTRKHLTAVKGEAHKAAIGGFDAARPAIIEQAKNAEQFVADMREMAKHGAIFFKKMIELFNLNDDKTNLENIPIPSNVRDLNRERLLRQRNRGGRPKFDAQSREDILNQVEVSINVTGNTDAISGVSATNNNQPIPVKRAMSGSR